MTPHRRSITKQRLAAAGIAAGATLGSFAAVSALGSTSAETAAVATPTDDQTSDDQTSDDGAVTGDRHSGEMGIEEPLTGDLADQVTAAAGAAVPGGTVERVETDAHGATYEAHMLDADGNPVTVTFDDDLEVVDTLTDGPGGRHDHSDDDTADEDADTTTG